MKLIVGFIVLSFTDVAVTVLLTKYFGALPTYSLFVALTVIGLSLQWFRKKNLNDALATVKKGFEAQKESGSKEAFRDPEVVEAFVEVEAFWISTFLLIIPGPLTAGLAFILMLPIARRKMAKGQRVKSGLL